MTCTRLYSVVAIGLTTALVGAGGAAAQSYIDLKGTWVGTGQSIVDGPAPHHPADAPAVSVGTHRLREVTFTTRIEGQDGRRFWGTLSSEHKQERIIGSFSVNGKHVYMVNEVGYIDGDVVDADTLEICYRHVNASSAVVACNVWKRRK